MEEDDGEARPLSDVVKAHFLQFGKVVTPGADGAICGPGRLPSLIRAHNASLT